MKHLLLIAITIMYAHISSAQHSDPYISIMLERLTNAKASTIAYAQAMPADKYDFKPTPEEMSFAQQLTHIAGNLTGISSRYIQWPAPGFKVNAKATHKDSIITMVADAYDYCLTNLKNMTTAQLTEQVKFFAGDKNKMQMVNLLNDHQTHHRGQLAVYLRLCGVKPPAYVGW